MKIIKLKQSMGVGGEMNTTTNKKKQDQRVPDEKTI